MNAASRSASPSTSRRTGVGNGLERVDADPIVVVAPGAGHPAVHQEGSDRLRDLDVEDPLPVVLRQDQGSARVDEQRGVPGRQEPHRHGGCGIGDGPAREVHQGFPVLAQEPPDADPFERRIHRRERHTGEARDVLARGGPEPGEVAPNQDLEAGVRGELRRWGTDPVLRQARRGRLFAAPRCRSAARGPDRAIPWHRSRSWSPCRVPSPARIGVGGRRRAQPGSGRPRLRVRVRSWHDGWPAATTGADAPGRR